jgi:hypothetical protein
MAERPLRVVKNVPEGEAARKGFMGKAALIEGITSVRGRALSEEVAAEFASFSEEPSRHSADKGKIERDLRDYLGVPLRVFEAPKEAFSQRQIERLSAELKRLESARRPKKKTAPSRASVLRAEIVHEFTCSPQLPLSSDIRQTETLMRDVAGVHLTVRTYSKSKRKRLAELESE